MVNPDWSAGTSSMTVSSGRECKLVPAPSLEELMGPDSIYHQLVELEHEINYKIARKQAQMADALFRTVKIKRTLKVLVSHTVEDEQDRRIALDKQPESGGKPEDSLSRNDNPEMSSNNCSWTLRIEGKLGATGRANSKVPSEPFQHYLKSLIVQIGDTITPSAENNTVEWVKGPSTVPLTDGFEIKRRITDSHDKDDIPVKIFLRLDERPERYRPSPQLAPLINDKPLISKPAAILAIWQYVKSLKLQESDEKKTVRCDETLKQLFDCSSFSFSELAHRLAAHLLPASPLTIDYIISRGRSGGGRTWEFELEVEDPTKNRPSLSSPSLLAQQREIGMLEHRLHEVDLALRATTIQEQLMRRMAEDPLKCIQRLMEAQCADQQVVAGEPPLTMADLIRSSNFNTEDMERAVSLFWSTTRSTGSNGR